MSAVAVDRVDIAGAAVVGIVPPVLVPPQLPPYSQVPGLQMVVVGPYSQAPGLQMAAVGLSGFVAFAVWALQAPQISASLPPPPDRTYSSLGPHMPLAPPFQFSASACRRIWRPLRRSGIPLLQLLYQLLHRCLMAVLAVVWEWGSQ